MDDGYLYVDSIQRRTAATDFLYSSSKGEYVYFPNYRKLKVRTTINDMETSPKCKNGKGRRGNGEMETPTSKNIKREKGIYV